MTVERPVIGVVPRMSRRALRIAACTLLAFLVVACLGPSPTAQTPLANVIHWSTASESDNFGFDVYRSENRDGPFERVTRQPLAGGGTTDLSREYRFLDDAIEAGQEYFYYVESVSLSGERKRFTPVMRASPKYP